MNKHDYIHKEMNLLSIFNEKELYSEFLTLDGYLIYKIENKITNKVYIGDTKINLLFRFFLFPMGGAHFSEYTLGKLTELNLELNEGNYNNNRPFNGNGVPRFKVAIIKYKELFLDQI